MCGRIWCSSHNLGDPPRGLRCTIILFVHITIYKVSMFNYKPKFDRVPSLLHADRRGTISRPDSHSIHVYFVNIMHIPHTSWEYLKQLQNIVCITCIRGFEGCIWLYMHFPFALIRKDTIATHEKHWRYNACCTVLVIGDCSNSLSAFDAFVGFNILCCH